MTSAILTVDGVLDQAPVIEEVDAPAWGGAEFRSDSDGSALDRTESAEEAADRLVSTHLPDSVAGPVLAGGIAAEGELGRACVAGELRARNWANAKGAASLLFVSDPLVVLATGRALHWALVPGGAGVTARADALRFLRTVSRPSAFRVWAEDVSLDPPALPIEGGTWQDEEEWLLFEDLAALEEWSGVPIPMPVEVTADEASEVATGARWARAGFVAANLTGPITFEAPSVGPADELRVREEFSARVLGLTIPLGAASARIPISVTGTEQLAPKRVRYTAEASADTILFWLTAPAHARSGLRTQLPHAEPTAGDWAPPEGTRRCSTSLAAALRSLGDRDTVDTTYPASRALRYLRGE